MPSTTLDENEVARKDIISTGHSEIDKKLGGGVPLGSLIFIEGESDAGKSVLCQQMIWGSLNNKFKVLLFTSENTVKSLVSQMNSLGLEILDPLLMGWLRIYTMRLSQEKASAKDTFQIILDTINRRTECQLVIIDALTPVVSQPGGGGEALAYFERCKTVCDKGRTIINVAHTHAFEQDLLMRVRSICDAHFKLTIDKAGDKLVKSLEVAKLRGASQSTGNILAFDVEPGIGMKIMPISRTKA